MIKKMWRNYHVRTSLIRCLGRRTNCFVEIRLLAIWVEQDHGRGSCPWWIDRTRLANHGGHNPDRTHDPSTRVSMVRIEFSIMVCHAYDELTKFALQTTMATAPIKPMITPKAYKLKYWNREGWCPIDLSSVGNWTKFLVFLENNVT